MNDFLYFTEESAYLAKRWLRSRASENDACNQARLHIVSPKSSVPLANTLRTDYPTIERIWELPDVDKVSDAFCTQVGNSPSRAITIPVSLSPFRFRKVMGQSLPDLRPLYPVVSQLWAYGFRKFDIPSLGATMHLTIPHLLEEFKGRHEGQRCFVVGNGPSLNQINMLPLKDEITFGSNRCYLGYERWQFQFTYWCISDYLQIEVYADEYEDSIPAETVKFVPLEYLPLLRMEHLCPVYFTAEHEADGAVTPDRLDIGHSVTYALIQLAILMGCNPIILVGVDHRYSLRESGFNTAMRHLREQLVRPLRRTFAYHVIRSWREHKTKVSPLIAAPGRDSWDAAVATQATHFDVAYSQGESKVFSLPELRETERDFKRLIRWTSERGIEILNATPNSALEVFPSVDYDTLF